jgi:outer membrane protein TolC
MAETDLEAARLSVEEKRLGLKLSITEVAYGLDAAHKTVALINGEVDLLKQLEAITRTKYATGAADQQDVIKAQAEITMMQQRAIDARSRVTSMKARMNTLMGRRADADLGEVIVHPPPMWPQPNLSNWLARAEADNPDLGKARVMAARSRLEERLMRRGFYPDLKLKAEVTRDRGADETFVMLGIGVELPLQIAATRAGVREANRMALAAEAEREAMRQETEYMIQDIASCCASAWQNLELLKVQLAPQAEARYKASEDAYAAGKSDFLDLLESQRFRLNVRVMVVMTEAEVATQLARLERLLGGPVAKPQVEGRR